MVADRSTATQFELRLDGYEGPLDALLEMMSLVVSCYQIAH